MTQWFENSENLNFQTSKFERGTPFLNLQRFSKVSESSESFEVLSFPCSGV
jgi:hypothetical protein